MAQDHFWYVIAALKCGSVVMSNPSYSTGMGHKLVAAASIVALQEAGKDISGAWERR